jgi:hypothetical protein
MCISALAFYFCRSLRSGSSLSSFGRGKFACECKFFGKHTCVITLIQEQFLEGVSFPVRYLKVVKIVSLMNAIV